MNKNKFRNFIGKILIILMLALLTSGPTIAFARAGGGHSSSSHSSSSHSSSSSSSSSGSSNPIHIIEFIVTCIVIILITRTICNSISRKRKAKSFSVIRELSIDDNNWNYSNIRRDVRQAFYKVQTAWMRRNQEIAKEYISTRLYDEHKLKIEEIKEKKEINILKNMKLLSAQPVGLQDFEGIERDCMWIHVKGKSKDYIISEETNEVIKGEKDEVVYFEEYWKFIRNEYRWILDEIRQTNDIGNLKLFKIKVDNEKSFK